MLNNNPTRPKQDDQAVFDQQPLLLFRIEDRHYAFAIDDVIEVSAMVELITPPGLPLGLLGVFNRHGDPVPILDLRSLMTGATQYVSASSLFIVIRKQDALMGVVVDEVEQVIYVPRAGIKQVSTSGRYIHGIITYNERLLQLVSAVSLFADFASDHIVYDGSKVDTS